MIRAFSFGDHKEKSKLIGQLLAYSVVPALPKSALVKKRFDALQAFMEDNKSYLAMSGMIPFAKKTQAMADKVQRFMRLQLHKTDGNAVSLTADAIKFWMQEAPQSAEAERLVQLMIDMVVAGRKEGLAGMLCAIKGLIEVGKINAKEEAELAESLPIIYANADYAKLDHQTLEAVNAPLVRAECVRLARVLLGRLEQGKETKLLKAMLEQAKSDSLPEVRMV